MGSSVGLVAKLRTVSVSLKEREDLDLESISMTNLSPHFYTPLHYLLPPSHLHNCLHPLFCSQHLSNRSIFICSVWDKKAQVAIGNASYSISAMRSISRSHTCFFFLSCQFYIYQIFLRLPVGRECICRALNLSRRDNDGQKAACHNYNFSGCFFLFWAVCTKLTIGFIIVTTVLKDRGRDQDFFVCGLGVSRGQKQVSTWCVVFFFPEYYFYCYCFLMS